MADDGLVAFLRARPPNEEWRPVPGYEGLYAVSRDGQVASAPRRRTKGGLLTAKVGRRGYPTVSLVCDGRQRTRYVHSLVALAFLGTRPDGQEIRHLDGDRLNSRADNLAYGTRSENIRDKRGHGTDHNVNKTHCARGHAYDAANTYVLPSRPTARYCKSCSREAGRLRYRLKYSAAARASAAVVERPEEHP